MKIKIVDRSSVGELSASKLNNYQVIHTLDI